MRLKKQFAALALACAASAAAPGARAQDAPSPDPAPAPTPAPAKPPAVHLRVVPAEPPAPGFGGTLEFSVQTPPAPGKPAPAPRPTGEQKRRLGDLYRAHVEGQTVKAAYLGVSTSPVPPALRQHLGLPEGVGLVVDFVEKGSPAEAAGLKQYDVLHKLDDQILVNAQQLAVLVRARKAGEEAKLGIIRGGKPETVVAKLVEKEVKPLTATFFGGFDPNVQVEFGFAPEHEGEAGPAPRKPARAEVRQSDDRSVTTFADGEHTLTVTRRGWEGKRHLTAKNKHGKTLFDGPIDSDADRRNLPGEIAQKLKQMEAVKVPPDTRPKGPDLPGQPDGRRDGDEKGGDVAPDPGDASIEPEASVIRPDDLVEIRVNDLESPGVETVKVARVRKGQVGLPHVGPVQAEGLTPRQLELKVVEAYREADLIESATVKVRKVSNVRDFERPGRVE